MGYSIYLNISNKRDKEITEKDKNAYTAMFLCPGSYFIFDPLLDNKTIEYIDKTFSPASTKGRGYKIIKLKEIKEKIIPNLKKAFKILEERKDTLSPEVYDECYTHLLGFLHLCETAVKYKADIRVSSA
ncbi:MAG: hypothetical protein QXO19_01465 [Candidatus Aenigmatarchaeota archaeon]